MTDDDNDTLDTLIDDVAQAMTTSTPGGPAGDDFARRVSTRIAEAGDHRQSWFRPWVLVPLAAAIVLIVLVRLTPDTTRSVRLKPDATPDATKDETARLKADPTYETAQVETARAQPVARGPERAALQIAAPMTVTPIDVDSIDVQPLVEMNVIQITPIAIERIEISPMP